MKITLTPSQIETLRQAPNDWAPLPDHLCTSVLRIAGLIAIRDAPGARSLDLGFVWKITPLGFRHEGRTLTPKPEPEVAAQIAEIHRLSKRRKTPA